jgi:hypothetical protein
VSVQDETCHADTVKTGIVTVDFGTTISNGEYRLLTEGRCEISRESIPPNGQIDININSGTYLLELTADGCSYPIQTLSIGKASQVDFTGPTALNIRETFSLKPETEQNLSFLVTYPDGTTQTINSGKTLQ